MRRIDAHFHINFKGYDLDKIVSYLDKDQIDACWLLSWEETNSKNPGYIHLGPEAIYDAYKVYPSRIIPFYAPDPLDPKAVERLFYWHDRGFKGCGELKSSSFWCSSGTTRLLEAVSLLKLPILFHMENSYKYLAPLKHESSLKKLFFKIINSNRFSSLFPVTLKFISEHISWLKKWVDHRTILFPGYLTDFLGLESALIRFPSLNFIAHGPLFWAQMYSEQLVSQCRYTTEDSHTGLSWQLMLRYRNLFADLSCVRNSFPLVNDHFASSKMVEIFSDRIIYGSDNLPGYSESFLDPLDISSTILTKILGSTASSLLING